MHNRAKRPPPYYHQSTPKDGVEVVPAHLLFSGQIWLWLISVMSSCRLNIFCLSSTHLYSNWTVLKRMLPVPTEMSARCSPPQTSTLASFLAFANISCPHHLQKSPCCPCLWGPIKTMPKSLHVAVLQGASMESESIPKDREALLPQRSATLGQSAPQGFHECGQGFLKYLNSLDLHIAFTVGSWKTAQMTILTSFISLFFLPVTLPEENIFSYLLATK